MDAWRSPKPQIPDRDRTDLLMPWWLNGTAPVSKTGIPHGYARSNRAHGVDGVFDELVRRTLGKRVCRKAVRVQVPCTPLDYEPGIECSSRFIDAYGLVAKW